MCLVGGLVSLVSASCANLCDGHGQCNAFNACDCDEGYEGADCSLRSCPSGTTTNDLAPRKPMSDAIEMKPFVTTHVQLSCLKRSSPSL